MKHKLDDFAPPEMPDGERTLPQLLHLDAILVDGLVAGLLGALAIAVCFMLVDLSEGLPLSTPAVLSALLFRALAAGSEPSLGSTLVYTALHFGAFAAVGLVMAWLVKTTKRASVLALFVTIFIACSESVFVVLLADKEASFGSTVSQWSVLVANLVGVAVMLAYFFARNPGLGGNLLGSSVEVVSEGIVAGLLGGLAVALWFFLFDLSAGRPFQTPTILGAAIVGKQGAAMMASVSPELVFVYTVLHLAAFMVFGVLVAALLANLKRTEVLVAGLFLVFLLFELFFVGLMTMIDEEMLNVLRRWKVELGNLLATGVVLTFLLARNREVSARLVHGWRGLQAVIDHMVPKPPESR
jgi:hypothetical protein